MINLGSAVGYLLLDTKNFNAGLKTAMMDLKTFTDRTATTADKLLGLSNAAQKTGAALTKGLTLPLAAIGVAALKISSDFEAQMSKVKAISQSTEREFQDLKESAKELGETTVFSAREAALGMEKLASAGFKSNEIIEAMPGLLDLAASAGTNLDTAAENVSASLRSFNLAAEQSAHVADVFALAAASSNAQVEDMGEAMKYAGPVASAFGISLEETAAAIGIMADAGIKGSQAGTTLRGALIRLTKPTDQMLEVMERYNLSFYDAQGNMKGLSEIVKELEVGLSGLTQEQRDHALSTLLGQQAVSGMISLMQRGSQELSVFSTALETSDGTAKEMAKTMLDNLSGSIKLFLSALEGAGISIGEILTPGIKSAVDNVTSLITTFNRLDDRSKKIIVTIGLFGAGIGPLLILMASITKATITWSGALGIMTGTMSTASPASLALAGNLGLLKTAFTSLFTPYNLILGLCLSLIIALKDQEGTLQYLRGAVIAFTAAMIAMKGAIIIAPIITATTAALTGQALATNASTAATIAYNVAQKAVAITSGLSTTAIGLLTGSISLSSISFGVGTAAATTFGVAVNAAIWPITLIVGAITLLGTGLFLLSKNANKVSEDIKELSNETDELVNKQKELNQTIQSDKESWSQKEKEINNQTIANRKLADEIKNLSDQENLTIGQRTLLQTKIKDLNESVKGLALAYNEETGELNLSIDAIYERIKAQEATQKVTAQMQQQNKVRQQIVELETQIAIAQEKRAEAQRKLDHEQPYMNGPEIHALQDAVEELNRLEQESTSLLQDKNREYQYLNDEIVKGVELQQNAAQQKLEALQAEKQLLRESADEQSQIRLERIEQEEALTQSMIDEANKRGVTVEEYAELQEQAIEDTKKAYEELAGVTQDAFSKIKQETAQTASELTANLNHNQQVVENWSNNLAKLAEKGLSEGFIAELRKAGPEASKTVAALTNATQEELKELSNAYEKGGKVAADALKKQLGLPEVVQSGTEMVDELASKVKDNKNLEKEVVSVIENAKKAMDSEVSKSNFGGVGSNIIDGVINGLNAGRSRLLNVVSGIAKSVETTFKNELEIRSPSRAFERLGRYIDAGLEKGLTDNMGLPTKAMEQISNAILKSGNVIKTGLIDSESSTFGLLYDKRYEFVMSSIDLFYKERDTRLSLLDKGTDQTIRAIERELRATEQAYDVKMKLIQQEYDARMALVDSESSDKIKSLQSEIDKINKEKEQERREESTARFERELREKQRLLNDGAKSEQDRAKIIQEIQELQARRDKELLEQRRQDRQEELRSQIQEARDAAHARKEELRSEYEERKQQLERQKEDELNAIRELQEKLKEDLNTRKELQEIQTKIKKAEEDKKSKAEIDELRRREKELKQSLITNTNDLRGYSVELKNISYQNGRDFLSGFTHTRGELFAYLDEVKRKADAARAAQQAATSFTTGLSNKLVMKLGFDGYSVMGVKSGGHFTSDNSITNIVRGGIDYDKLAEAINKGQKPQVNYNPVFNSPKALDEKEVKRNNELFLRDIDFYTKV